MIAIALAMMSASWADQCSVAVYDYADQMCYVEDAEQADAVCSEWRTYYTDIAACVADGACLGTVQWTAR
jgi:hypothetical protein